MSFRTRLFALLVGFAIAQLVSARTSAELQDNPETANAADIAREQVEPSSASDDSDAVYSLVIEDGDYRVTIDTSATPDLTDWANSELAPVVRQWYPKIVAMLPSDGFHAPRRFSITFNETDRGVAYASGNSINCSSAWFRNNFDGEAKGAVVHEMVHVVQQYRGGRLIRGERSPGE